MTLNIGALNIGALATSCAFVLTGLMVTSTQAAPLASSLADFKTTAGTVSYADKAAFRRCRSHKGRQHCRSYSGTLSSYGHRYGNESSYYVHDASELPFGSKRWWDQKESEGSLGRP